MFETERPENPLDHMQRQWDEEEKAAEMPPVRSGFHTTPDGGGQDNADTHERTFRLKHGDPVRVRRTSGAIEEGWVVHEIHMDGYYRVIKDTGGKEVLEKFIPWGELESLNPAE